MIAVVGSRSTPAPVVLNKCQTPSAGTEVEYMLGEDPPAFWVIKH